jgi:hypothetical protein
MRQEKKHIQIGTDKIKKKKNGINKEERQYSAEKEMQI